MKKFKTRVRLLRLFTAWVHIYRIPCRHNRSNPIVTVHASLKGLDRNTPFSPPFFQLFSVFKTSLLFNIIKKKKKIEDKHRVVSAICCSWSDCLL